MKKDLIICCIATLLPLLARAAEFPQPLDTQSTNETRLTSPQDAARKMTVPPGFNVTLFAGEPDVQNPIAFTTDARGRLWVAENYSYAESRDRFDGRFRDRIVILEDTNGDGRFDKRTVFWDGAQRLTSVEVGFGGVWALCLPHLLFIPDRNGDDVPDGEPQVVLDGFNVQTQHNFVNGLKWGPDGWLYGRHGIVATSVVGAPGSPDDERAKFNCSIWRYHPTRRVVEAVTHGTTNPWGLDWNDYGEAFFINTVIGHLWHVIPGAHYQRMYGEDLDPHVYGLIEQHADHYHWDKRETWADVKKAMSDTTALAGGGHAHCGLMFYLGDNWPAAYRDALFTVNLHGRRLNMDRPERAGSGYVGKHGEDFLFANDPWFRAIDLIGGPDGSVYIADWCDIGECHETDGVHRTSGRIFKVSYGKPAPPASGDLAKLSDAELVKLQLNRNDWFVRQSRRLLQERAAAGRDLSAAHAQLRAMFDQQQDVTRKLRALWALNVTGGASEPWLRELLHHQDEHVRVWVIRLLTDQGATTEAATKEFARLVTKDQSAFVRLALASALQRLPVTQRAALAAPMLARASDVADHNLPLMLWFGVKDIAASDPLALARLADRCEMPIVRQFIARRLGEDIEKNPAPLDALLRAAASKPETFRADVLGGLAEALRGWRKALKPASWDAVQAKFAASPALHDRVRDLSVIFGDGLALDEVRCVALDDQADFAQRRAALQTLMDNGAPDLREICVKLIRVRELIHVAAHGLARFDEPAVGELIANHYRGVMQPYRAEVIAVLASRPTFARSLLSRVGSADAQIPRQDISAFQARQIRSFNDPKLNEKLAAVWGELRDTDADKRALIVRLKQQLTPDVVHSAKLSAGRAIFQQTCAPCHTLFGQGGRIAPDLTGGNRNNLDYLLENIADPSATVPADFRMSILELKDGRTLSGVIGGKTDRTLTLQTATEKLTLERAEIESIRESTLSLMPEGLLAAFNETQVRNLIGYLMSPQQVPLPPTTAPAGH